MPVIVGFRRDQRGIVLVGAIVIIAILFFMGTMMVLAIESGLHTADQIGRHDAQAYAADSAVARGVAEAAAGRRDCVPTGMIRELGAIQQFSVDCHRLGGKVVGESISRSAIAPAELSPGKPMPPIVVNAPDIPGKVWTVIGWQRLDGAASSLSITVSGTMCGASVGFLQVSNPGAVYVCFEPTARNAQMSIAGSGSVALSAFVVRAASARKAKDELVTVVGTAGAVVDEADVLLPEAGKPTLALWRTVRP